MERNNFNKRGGKGNVKISELFKKYTDVLKAPQGTVIKNFIEVIEDVFNVTLRADQCSYSVASRTLTLRISGMLKTEILLKKKYVLEHMNHRLGKKNELREIL